MSKVNILLAVILLSFSSLQAQENDSLDITGWLDGLEKPYLTTPMIEQGIKINTTREKLENLVPVPELKLEADPKQVMPAWHWSGLNLPNFTTDQSPLLKGDYNVGGLIFGNRRSYLYGSGQQQHIPGIGANASASVGYAWLINDRLSVTTNASLQKTVGLMPMTYTYGGFGAQVNYQINDRLSVHAFGNYNANMYSLNQWTWNYGGYLDWQMAEHWGTKLGVQHTQEYTGYSRTTPIIMPYYKMENGTKIGVDFGGLIQNLLQKQNHGVEVGPGVMPSPKQFITMPRVAPRN